MVNLETALTEPAATTVVDFELHNPDGSVKKYRAHVELSSPRMNGFALIGPNAYNPKDTYTFDKGQEGMFSRLPEKLEGFRHLRPSEAYYILMEYNAAAKGTALHNLARDMRYFGYGEWLDMAIKIGGINLWVMFGLTALRSMSVPAYKDSYRAGDFSFSEKWGPFHLGTLASKSVHSLKVLNDKMPDLVLLLYGRRFNELPKQVRDSGLVHLPLPLERGVVMPYGAKSELNGVRVYMKQGDLPDVRPGYFFASRGIRELQTAQATIQQKVSTPAQA